MKQNSKGNISMECMNLICNFKFLLNFLLRQFLCSEVSPINKGKSLANQSARTVLKV